MTFFNQYRTYILLSLIAHILLVVAMFIGSWFEPEPESGQKRVVQAVIIDPDAIERQAESIRAKRAAAEQSDQDKAKREEERLVQEKARQEKLEQERNEKLAQEKAEKEQREADRLRLAEEEKKQQEELILARQKAEQEKLEQEKLEQEKLEQEKLAEEKAEQERIEQEQLAEAERLKQLEAEKLEAEKLEAEKLEAAKTAETAGGLDDLFASIDVTESADPVPNAPPTGGNDPGSAMEPRVLSEIGKMAALYKRKITDKITNPSNYKGKTCKLNFKLSPIDGGKNGLVKEVKSSSGDSRLCTEAIRAIKAVNIFELHDDPAVVSELLNNEVTVHIPE